MDTPYAPYQQQGELARAKAAPMTLQPATQRMASWLERAWMSRYLDRQLSGEESAWFEAYVLDKPELLAIIDADTTLRDALSHDGSSERDEAIANRVHAVASPSDERFDARPQKHEIVQRWLRHAAAVMIGVGIGGLGAYRLQPSDAAPIIGSLTRVVYDTIRGETVSPRVENGARLSDYVLLETPAPFGATEISITIDDQKSISVTPGADGYISILIRKPVFAAAKTATISYRVDGKMQQQSLDLTNNVRASR